VIPGIYWWRCTGASDRQCRLYGAAARNYGFNTEAACQIMKFYYENFKGWLGEDHQTTKIIEA
jgi:hypothetical protein